MKGRRDRSGLMPLFRPRLGINDVLTLEKAVRHVQTPMRIKTCYLIPPLSLIEVLPRCNDIRGLPFGPRSRRLRTVDFRQQIPIFILRFLVARQLLRINSVVARRGCGGGGKGFM